LAPRALISAHVSDDRKHLTEREVEKLIEATKGSPHEARDWCLLLLIFRHGLRVSEHVCLAARPGGH
jgi:site-specific recombinase XerD